MNKAVLINKINHYFTDKPVNKVILTGSYARGENHSKSDIDLIISMRYPVGLITFCGYIIDLEKLLGIPVDMTTEEGISKFALPIIKKDFQIIYESKR